MLVFVVANEAPAAEPRSAQELLPASHESAAASGGDQTGSEYWGFSEDTRLVRLPVVAGTERPSQPAESQATAAIEDTPDDLPGEPLGRLLAPIEQVTTPPAPQACEDEVASRSATTDAKATGLTDPVVQGDVAQEGLTQEELRLLKLIERDSLAVSTGVPTTERLDREARQKISEASRLAQRGATYAARQSLIEVLRLVSQAKDKQAGGRLHTECLAAGLRALDEAEDFVPRGTQLEAEMVVDVICASHRTPIGREVACRSLLPSQLVDRYNRYAQIKLASAVAGEPAGSMALYTLGKLNSQLGVQQPEQHRVAHRRAIAFQQASLLAHEQNYLAAHELGVLLAEAGHLTKARTLFIQVAAQQPTSTVYRNLARVQEELGQIREASLCRAEAARLTRQGLGSAPQVAWVSPEQFVSHVPLNTEMQVARQPSPVKYH